MDKKMYRANVNKENDVERELHKNVQMNNFAQLEFLVYIRIVYNGTIHLIIS